MKHMTDADWAKAQEQAKTDPVMAVMVARVEARNMILANHDDARTQLVTKLIDAEQELLKVLK